MATIRKRSTSTKTSSARKASRKLTLKKETMKDLAPAASAAKGVRGGKKNMGPGV